MSVSLASALSQKLGGGALSSLMVTFQGNDSHILEKDIPEL